MIKSMFKRTILSIVRKPSRTIILGIILFVMANLVLASISIKASVNESTDFAKKTLGSTVYLSVNMANMREQTSSSRGQNREVVRMIRPSVGINEVKKMGFLSYVKDFTYSVSATANASGFDIVEYEEETLNRPDGFRSGSISMASLIGNIQINGINAYAFINEVKNNTMNLIEGTYFDESTDNKIIISYALAENNDFNVGDKIKLKQIETNEILELEIIGIYDVNEENYSENTIYMNTDTASKFLRSELVNEGNYGVSNVRFELINPDDSEKFINEAKEIYDLEANNMILDIDSSAYDKMAGPIESVGSFADTILWIVVIASILIITLMINSNVKDRKYEMGVLMSLGASKKNVIFQILSELVIIGTVSFVLSFGTSYFLANTMSKNILASRISMNEVESENNFGRPNMNGIRIGSIFNSSDQNVEVIDEIDISVNVKDYIILFLIGYGVMILAMGIPTLNIVKYEPKTILTGRE